VEYTRFTIIPPKRDAPANLVSSGGGAAVERRRRRTGLFDKRSRFYL
jgi:hypothetical protein